MSKKKTKQRQLLSACQDSQFECMQYTSILEASGYHKKDIDTWAPNTIDGAIRLLWNASIKAYDSEYWHNEFNQPDGLAKKMAGSILETLVEAIINSQLFARVLPGQPTFCYHRGDYGIEDFEMGSPDKITKTGAGELQLVNIKASPNVRDSNGNLMKITVNKNNTANIFQWREVRLFRDPNDPLAVAKVQVITNLNAGDDVIKGTKNSIYGPRLSKLVDDQFIEEFWKKFWNALWENQNGVKQHTFPGLYDDQKKLVYNKICNSSNKVMTVLAACGVGKTIMFREMVRKDYEKNNINGKGIYCLSFPRIALGSQHNDTFSELDPYSVLVNASTDKYKQHLKSTKELQLNTATTSSGKIALLLIKYLDMDQNAPLLILNTDKGIRRLHEAFKLIESGAVCMDENDDHSQTYELVKMLCRQFHHDEVHNYVMSSAPQDEETKSFKKKLFEALPYFNEVFKKSVYWTATQKINGSEYDMSNEDIFGKVEAEYSFSDAADNGRILKSDVNIISLSEEDAEKLKDNGDERDFTFFIRAIRDHKEWCDKMKLDCQIMFFSKGVGCLESYKEQLEKIFDNDGLFVDYVTAETSQRDRIDIFNDYKKSKFGILMNYDIIAEGIDIPSTTAVVVGRGMNDIKIVQATSRGIRLHDDDRKEFAKGVKSKIKVEDKSKWKKPCGWLYLFEDESVAEDTKKMTEIEKILIELQENHNMIHGFKYLDNEPGEGKDKLDEVNPKKKTSKENKDLAKMLQVKNLNMANRIKFHLEVKAKSERAERRSKMTVDERIALL